MNGSHDVSATPPAADGDRFHHAADAAALLVDARRAARRGFEPRPPLACLATAVALLAVYGTLWLSVRGQDPYVGPSPTVTGWVYAMVAVSIAATVTLYRRAVRGVHGRSRRDDAVAALAVGVPWIAVYVFNGALHADGFGDSLVYGVFDAAGPWLVVGAGAAALAAGREQWGRMAGGLTAVVVGTTAAFFGPAGCWGVLAVAGFTGFLALAVVQHLRLRRV